MALQPQIAPTQPLGYQHALLGDIAFDLITYFDGSSTKFGADYAEHAHIGNKPQLQFTGLKLHEISWQLTFHRRFCDPEAELLKLKAAVEKHEVLPLVFANGDYKGKFVVQDVDVTSKQTLKDGTMMSCEASVTLREYIAPQTLSTAKPKQAPVAIKRGKQKPAKTVKRQPKPRAANTSTCRI